MNARQKKTLAAIFARPTRGDFRWRAIESLLVACGAELNERRGSRVAVRLRNRIAIFHRPHLSPNAKEGLVDSVRRFLDEAGIRPE